MTEAERLSIAEQLALVTGTSKYYFLKMTDKKIKKELEKNFGSNNY